MSFSQRLEHLMQRDGITKYRISKTVGCSATTVANWLSGTAPTGEYLQKLSEMFDVSVDYLLGNEEKEKPLVNGDEELTEYLEELKNRDEMRMLFSLTKGATKADVEKAVKVIEAMLGK